VDDARMVQVRRSRQQNDQRGRLSRLQEAFQTW
jgi:hypothetical protein